MSDRGGYDIRLEAAAAKEWNTFRAWEIVDDTMQIRGGRGYETEASLAARGEEPIGVERMMRDYRINKIFEGSTEIMHLFMAREMVDKHLAGRGRAHRPRQGPRREARARCRAWPPSTPGGTRRAGSAGASGRATPPSVRSPAHLRFVDAQLARLARQSFHGMLRLPGEAAEQAGVPVPPGRHRERAVRHGGLRSRAPARSRTRAAGGAGGDRPRAAVLPQRAPAHPRALPRPVEQRRRPPLPRGAGRAGRPPRLARGRHPLGADARDREDEGAGPESARGWPRWASRTGS